MLALPNGRAEEMNRVEGGWRSSGNEVWFDWLVSLCGAYGRGSPPVLRKRGEDNQSNQTECLFINQTTPFAEETRQIESCF